MTKIEKVLGVVALVAILLAGVSYYKTTSQTIRTVQATSPMVGSSQTSAIYATAGTVSNQGGLFLWDTDLNSGLEVAGPTHLASTTISKLTISGTAAFTNATFISVTTTNLAATGVTSLSTTTVTHGMTVGDGTNGLIISGNSGANLGTGSIAAGAGSTVQFFGSFFGFGANSLATSTFTNHLISTGGLPTVSVGGASYVAGGLTAGSTDIKGSVSSTVATANSGLVTVNFSAPFALAPICVVSNANALSATDTYDVTSSITGMSINIPAGMTSGTKQYNYHCIQ